MNTKLVGLSIDSVEDHQGWIKDIQAYNNLEGDFPFPIVADDRTLAVKFGMLDPDELDKKVNFIILKPIKTIFLIEDEFLRLSHYRIRQTITQSTPLDE